MRFYNRSRYAVFNEFSCTAAIGGNNNRLGREHSLQRDVTVIFIKRQVTNTQSVRIQIDQLIIRNKAAHANSIRNTVLFYQRLIVLDVAGSAGEYSFDRRAHVFHRFNQKLLPLLRLHAAWIEDVVALFSDAQIIGQRWRMIEHFTFQVVVLLQTIRDGARIGEDLLRLGNELFVAVLNPFANARTFGIGGEIVELSSPEVISRAVLMQDPQNFVWMSDEISREFHPNHEIDALSVCR